MQDKSKQEIILEEKKLADKVCKELLNGNKKIITLLYDKFHNTLCEYVKLKLKNYGNKLLDGIEDVMTKFWMKILENPDVICNFKGNSQLKTYFFKIVYNIIVDVNRKNNRDVNEYSLSSFTIDEGSETIGENILRIDCNLPDIENIFSEDMLKIASGKKSEEIEIEECRRVLLRRSLRILSEQSPEDAKLIADRILHGLSYEEIVDRDFPQIEAQEKKKVMARFRKKVERAMRKMEGIVVACLKELNLKKEDLFL